MVILSDEQRIAVERLKLHVAGNGAPAFLTLEGYAGTGKTTTVAHWLAEASQGLRQSIVLSAPTHKAVKVFRRMVTGIGLDIDCATVHSALGLKLRRVEGVNRLVRGHRGPSIDRGAVLVVDECSMISTELFGHIERVTGELGLRVIFVGDPAQLPPVGEQHSQTFESGKRVTLRTVQRQRSQNPVLGLCTDIRNAIEVGETSVPTLAPGEAEGGTIGVHVMQGGLWEQWMPSAFELGGDFDDDGDSFRIVAYRNATVNRYNTHIQRLRYPGLKAPFAPGELVVMGDAVMQAAMGDFALADDDNEIAIANQTEARVKHVEPARHSLHADLPAWSLLLAVEGRELPVSVYVLDVSAHAERDTRQRELRSTALEAKENGDTDSAREAWQGFYALRDSFADVRCAYAMTAHKSQGSTFANVFVDVYDIWRNRDANEALRCLYVACSRASQNLILNSAGGMQ